MSLQQQLIVLAGVMLVALAVMRVLRVRRGRAPHPSGKARPLFIVAFLLVPPLVLEVATNPNAEAGQLHGIESLLVYWAALIGGVIVMGILALIVHYIAPARFRRTLTLALVGSEGSPDDVPFDPAMTGQLAERVALVERRNAVFPRGHDFPAQVGRSGFREDWDALDDATRSTRAADRQRRQARRWGRLPRDGDGT